MLKGGYIENGDLSTFRAIDQQKDEFVVKGIKESGKHAWYEDDEPLEPWAGLTRPKYTGWQDDGKYSWVKAPTFYGKVVEVGPLAYLMCGLAANDTPTVNHFNELKGIYEKLGILAQISSCLMFYLSLTIQDSKPQIPPHLLYTLG